MENKNGSVTNLSAVSINHPIWRLFLDSQCSSATLYLNIQFSSQTYFHSPTPWRPRSGGSLALTVSRLLDSFRPGSSSYSPFQSKVLELRQRAEVNQPPHLLRPSQIIGLHQRPEGDPPFDLPPLAVFPGQPLVGDENHLISMEGSRSRRQDDGEVRRLDDDEVRRRRLYLNLGHPRPFYRRRRSDFSGAAATPAAGGRREVDKGGEVRSLQDEVRRSLLSTLGLARLSNFVKAGQHGLPGVVADHLLTFPCQEFRTVDVSCLRSASYTVQSVLDGETYIAAFATSEADKAISNIWEEEREWLQLQEPGVISVLGLAVDPLTENIFYILPAGFTPLQQYLPDGRDLGHTDCNDPSHAGDPGTRNLNNLAGNDAGQASGCRLSMRPVVDRDPSYHIKRTVDEFSGNKCGSQRGSACDIRGYISNDNVYHNIDNVKGNESSIRGHKRDHMRGATCDGIMRNKYEVGGQTGDNDRGQQIMGIRGQKCDTNSQNAISTRGQNNSGASSRNAVLCVGLNSSRKRPYDHNCCCEQQHDCNNGQTCFGEQHGECCTAQNCGSKQHGECCIVQAFCGEQHSECSIAQTFCSKHHNECSIAQTFCSKQHSECSIAQTFCREQHSECYIDQNCGSGQHGECSILQTCREQHGECSIAQTFCREQHGEGSIAQSFCSGQHSECCIDQNCGSEQHDECCIPQTSCEQHGECSIAQTFCREQHCEGSIAQTFCSEQHSECCIDQNCGSEQHGECSIPQTCSEQHGECSIAQTFCREQHCEGSIAQTFCSGQHSECCIDQNCGSEQHGECSIVQADCSRNLPKLCQIIQLLEETSMGSPSLPPLKIENLYMDSQNELWIENPVLFKTRSYSGQTTKELAREKMYTKPVTWCKQVHHTLHAIRKILHIGNSH